MTNQEFGEHRTSRKFAAILTVGALAFTMPACASEPPVERVECMVTQPERVGAVSINGYPGNPRGGVFLNVLRLFGVTEKEYKNNFSVQSNRDEKTTTSAVIQSELRNEHVQRTMNTDYAFQLGDSDVLAFCVTFFDSKKPGNGGHIWEFEPGTGVVFKTTAVTNTEPKWLRQADRQYPGTQVFAMNQAASVLTPLQP